MVLPLLARGPLEGGAATYGLLTSAMGAGAIVGGLAMAGHGRTGLRPLTVAAAVFGVAILGAAAAPTLPVALVAMALVGAASITFLATGNTTLQLTSEPAFRGRVMALWTMAFLGSTPIGAPIIGAISEYASPRAGLLLGSGVPDRRRHWSRRPRPGPRAGPPQSVAPRPAIRGRRDDRFHALRPRRPRASGLGRPSWWLSQTQVPRCSSQVPTLRILSASSKMRRVLADRKPVLDTRSGGGYSH